MSSVEQLDGRVYTLEVAVRRVEEAGWGSLVVCIPGQLAYYYDELGERRALLLRDDQGNRETSIAAPTA